MSRPRALTLTKRDQQRITRMYSGSKTRKGIKNPRTISKELGLPHRQIMLCLESSGITSYSEGSYS